MKVPGNQIASQLNFYLKKEIKKLDKNKPQLAVFLVGNASDQLSFIKIKKTVAGRLGIKFQLVHYKSVPQFENFACAIKAKANDPAVHGIIIQQPLPAQLQTDSIYNFIPLNKEIEGHRRKSPFYPPIGLAVLTVIKWIYFGSRQPQSLLVDPKSDRLMFKRKFHNKKVVLVGRGITGGAPIGKTLTDFKINYINLNSKTPQPESYYQDADLIISAVGKKVIFPQYLKKHVVLINVGCHRQMGKLCGDYDETEIRSQAEFYTPTPGGVGPIDVFYLYKNLIDAYKLQQ